MPQPLTIDANNDNNDNNNNNNNNNIGNVIKHNNIILTGLSGPRHTAQNSAYSPKGPCDLVLGWQISQRPALYEMFFSHFLMYFTSHGEGLNLGNRAKWMNELPRLSSDGSNEALSLAVQATASAYCGLATANLGAIEEAARLYGQALGLHATLLRKTTQNKGKGKGQGVTVHMISTSVLFSLFEAMRSTTSQAYRAHIYGAAKMLEVTGPGECHEGVLCQLFFHIRTQMVFVHLTTKKEDLADLVDIKAERILFGTLQYQALPLAQRLMTQMASLAEVYAGNDVRMMEFTALSEEREERAGQRRKGSVLDPAASRHIATELENLYIEYYYQQSIPLPRDYLFTSNNTIPSTPAELPFYLHKDGFTALTVAYFSAARILLRLLAPEQPCRYLDRIDNHITIMSCAQYLDVASLGCAYMRMATPLYLVGVHSPHEEQREQAVSIFESWKSGSMAGVSAIALDRLYDTCAYTPTGRPLSMIARESAKRLP
ncbi:hypothetical protein P154DRAFT_427688 [Amniculicola lignicola CBS 123094]|uniref:Uncharacterized protein n=1 Tax=Amniculicola lignicola CBS 123094 TaxID=1392246 RepID=A0A6A5X1E1_9PLEO|nr:hypothetical protein P154DRAFT_427688 [Amniculicola lignicola CBS 123094]